MADWVFTVSEVGEFVKRSFDSQPMLQSLQVRGEISDLRRSAAGHMYFALKDERALLRCVYFRQDQAFGQKIAEGQRVTVTGRLSYYAEQGQINYYVKRVKADGVGNLFLLFEQRKARFQALGYFDAERKRPLPSMPERIGVITSPTGAVIRDIIRIIGRRSPRTQVVLYPVRVQGEGAAAEIAAGIRAFNARGNVDVLIVGRGGGSFEDLWEFNDEQVVRSIVESALPVISAVGHETDFTLADFAADVRAATPSEAAELAVPDTQQRLRQVTELSARLRQSMLGQLALRENELRLLERTVTLQSPMNRATDGLLRLDDLRERLDGAMARRLETAQTQVEHMGSLLVGMNPALVLQRGYAAVWMPQRGSYATGVAELSPNDPVVLRMADGSRVAVIAEDGETNGKETTTGL